MTAEDHESYLVEMRAADLRRLHNFTGACAYIATGGRHDWRFAALIAEDWAQYGAAVPSTTQLAATYGTTRRTVVKSLKRLVAADIIRILGKTLGGRLMFAPNLEKGDVWAKEREKLNRELERKFPEMRRDEEEPAP